MRLCSLLFYQFSSEFLEYHSTEAKLSADEPIFLEGAILDRDESKNPSVNMGRLPPDMGVNRFLGAIDGRSTLPSSSSYTFTCPRYEM
jgi:hypothetical protein